MPAQSDNDLVCCVSTVISTDGGSVGSDNWTPLIVANLVGFIPLAIVVAIMVWAARYAKNKSQQELEFLDKQADIFVQMEEGSMRRSHRSSMFLGSTRRKSMAGTYGNLGSRMSMTGSRRRPSESGRYRPMTLVVEKVEGQGVGIYVDEDLFVSEVKEDTPAWRAGISQGMVFKRVEDRSVANTDQLSEAIRNAPDRFSVMVLIRETKDVNPNPIRDLNASTKSVEVQMKLSRFRVTKPEGDEPLGLQLVGLELSHVEKDSAADLCGMRVGMHIYAVDGTRATVNNIARLISEAPSGFLLDCVCFPPPAQPYPHTCTHTHR